MKNKLIILIILTFQIIISQEPVFKSPYLTDEMRNSTKELLKFDKIVNTIKDDDRVEKLKKQVKFYRAISEAIYIQYNTLNSKNNEKIEKFEGLIKQYKDIVGSSVDELILVEAPEITYEYKPMKITSTAVRKQNHKKQAMIMKKNYILMFKYYKEISDQYTAYLQYLKEIKDSGQYKIKEELFSDSINSDSSLEEKQGIDSSNVQLLNAEKSNIVTSKESTLNQNIETKQVIAEELEKVNEELTYRIQSLEVRIDEIEEEENKKSSEISNQVSTIEKKIKKLEKSDTEVISTLDDLKEQYNDYSNRDYPEIFVDANNKGLTQFTYRGKTIYAFTRKEYKEAMSDARIYGKESFQLGNKTYDSRLMYEQIERLSK